MNLRSAGRMGLTDRPSKHDAFLALLREGWTSLHLDARRTGVVVPAHLQGEGHLVLQYGNDLPIPIPDLRVDEHGVTATLSFARSPQYTVVPWNAVYVVASDDGRGVLYHEDVPPDVSVIARAETDATASSSADGSKNGPHAGQAGSPATGGSGDPLSSPDTAASVDIAPRTPVRALRAVPMGGPIEEAGIDVIEDAQSQAQPLPARRRRRPQLRLVK